MESLPVPGFTWTQLETSDYPEYVARLRAFGVPERTVRDIIIADVQKLYRPKIAALRPPKPPPNPNFWEQRMFGYNPYGSQTPEQREHQRVLQKEQTDLVKALLGQNVYDEISRDSGYPVWSETMFGGLSKELRDKVQEMQQKYHEARNDIYAKTQGMMDGDTQTELKAVERKFRDELATVLTPEQLMNYELRSSEVAQRMRYELGPFEPTEEEFRAIFAHKQAMEDMNASRGNDPTAPAPSAEERKAMAERAKEMEKAFAATLGEERLKEYKMVEDYGYRSLFEAGVSKETVFAIADMKQQVEGATREIQRNTALTPEQRSAALKAIQAETQKSLNDMLGERRAKGYVRSGGYWIQRLSPQDSRP
jgi:hypothetical protein